MPKISALPPAGSLADDDETPFVDDSVGSTKKFTLAGLLVWLQSKVGWIVSAMIGDQEVTLQNIDTSTFYARQDLAASTDIDNGQILGGFAYVTGDGTNRRETVTVTFPHPFANLPIVVAGNLGAINGNNPTNIGSFLLFAGAAGDTQAEPHVFGISTTGFTIELINASAAFANGMRFGISWVAIGQKA